MTAADWSVPSLDPYQTWDAAYVLGALSPADRREFEEHLAHCPTCQQAVSELAGMPGLLGQVSPEDAAVLAVAPVEELDAGPPATLLPRMMTDLHARRRRMTGLLIGIAAALVLIVGGIAVGTGLLPLGPTTPRRLAFAPVAPSAITAVVDVVPVKEGTRFDVECQYGDLQPGAGSYGEYSIYVTDRAGHASALKDWYVKPNKVMRPQAMTPLKVSQIDNVEIRDTVTDRTVLRASLR